MKKINWKVRIQSIKFWLALVPAVLLVVQTVITPLGYNWDFGVLNQQLYAIINAIFGVLALLGVVVDPTTSGVTDSEKALSNKPQTKKQMLSDLSAEYAEQLKDVERKTDHD